MAGNKNSGRLPLDPSLHIARGTYRKDRHGDPSQLSMSGDPIKPRDLSKDASEHWDLIVKHLAHSQVAKEVDSFALSAMCEMWGLYRASLVAAKQNPIDKTIRSAVTAYLGCWNHLAACFGLTPADRQKLRAADNIATKKPASRKPA